MMKRRLALAILVPALVVAGACEDDDDESVFGTFNLFGTISEDSCADDEGTSFSAQMVIEGEPDDLTVRFGDDAVLTGAIDDMGLVQAQGPARAVVQGDTVDSTLQLQFGVRPSTSEASGRQVFDGTHPASPGVPCEQEFVASAQRASRSPVF